MALTYGQHSVSSFVTRGTVCRELIYGWVSESYSDVPLGSSALPQINLRAPGTPDPAPRASSCAINLLAKGCSTTV